MKSKISKEKISISISKEVNASLSEYCEKKLINKSKLINKLIGDFLEENGLKKQIQKND